MDYRLPNKRARTLVYGGGIRDILARADELEAAGRNVIHMEIGRPDFDSPKAAKEAAIRAIEAGDVHYTDMSGKPELRREIAAYYQREYGMTLDPDREVLVTSGAVEAMMATFFTMLNPGDEVIVPSPYFPVYHDQIEGCDGVLVPVPSRIEHDFRPQPEDIERAVTPKTRMIVINSPNNPTGASSKRSELEGIAAIAKKHDLLVLSDECYEKFSYDPDAPHVSIGSLPGMRERTFVLSAASKTFSMTGWRVGWLIFPPQTRPFLMKSHMALATCSTSFAQAGVAEALHSCWESVRIMIEEYRRRRDLMVEMLSKVAGFDVPTPRGAFYVLPNISRIGLSSFDFCTRLLEEEFVATVPGESFGAPEGYIRLAYCRPESEIREALVRITRFVERVK